ncbi:hypothetical protein BU16DRAFT_561204 [Lophium mytilinum]|uniref:DNA/RNA-binding domain-containing protein n=1 Tax=Lophium mytilinum TaxID=390894 RepID=A0A6A6QVG5_9PEZI|nr:hypothetical protein BU16DRAFT_561204 [Lophium mytilinum]
MASTDCCDGREERKHFQATVVSGSDTSEDLVDLRQGKTAKNSCAYTGSRSELTAFVAGDQSPSMEPSTVFTPEHVDTHKMYPMHHQNSYPDLISQPDSRPISQEQLAADLKSIYASLTAIESKVLQANHYLQIDELHRHEQALVTAHSALIVEHFEFFQISQHPAASPALRRLATKYSMPARLWKHGIHSLLEALRLRLPESLESMLRFLYFAYHMMGLFFEMFPAFETTWMESLGDLARYRMAIEEDDLRDRDIWSGVATSWYQKGAVKEPNAGRLSHHLAILARPNVSEQLSLFAKSLTSIKPFSASRESILDLWDKSWDPSLGSLPAQKSYVPAVDAQFSTVHHILFRQSMGDYTASATLSDRALLMYLGTLRIGLDEGHEVWQKKGLCMAMANIAGLFQWGSELGVTRHLFEELLHLEPCSSFYDMNRKLELDGSAVHDFSLSARLAFFTLEIFLQRIGDENALPHIHVMLIFLEALSWIPCMRSLMDMLPWRPLVGFLNALASEPNALQVHQGSEFPHSRKDGSEHCPEDFLVRGQIWSKLYWPADWFDHVETDLEDQPFSRSSARKLRAERILWLGARIANKHHTRIFHNHKTNIFSTDHELSLGPGEPDSIDWEVMIRPSDFPHSSMLCAKRSEISKIEPEVAQASTKYPDSFALPNRTKHPSQETRDIGVDESADQKRNRARVTEHKESTKINVRQSRKRQRQGLPITLEGRHGPATVMTCADSGSDINVISLELVRLLGFSIDDAAEHQLSFTMANGKSVRALGMTSANCVFSCEYHLLATIYLCWFYIFPYLPSSIIMGDPFLDQTRTMTDHRRRLVMRTQSIPQAPCVRSLGSQKRRLHCVLENREVLAYVDSGSDLNLMSLAYATRRGFQIRPSSQDIMFADGSQGNTTGIVDLDISYKTGKEIISNTVEARERIIQMHMSPVVVATFHILKNLKFDLLLGEDFLHEKKIFQDCEESFVSIQMTTETFGVHGIIHMGPAEQFLNDVTDKMKRRMNTLSGNKKKSKIDGTPSDLQHTQSQQDQKENARREKELARIALLSDSERPAAEQAEVQRQLEFEQKRNNPTP